jgi:SAM-dependent methyltransferase
MRLKTIVRGYGRLLSAPFRQCRYPFYEAAYLDKLAKTDERATPLSFLGGMRDGFFYWTLVHSAELGQEARGLVPGIPSPYHRRNWTGDAGERTFRQAMAFRGIVARAAGRYIQRPLAELELLDFGCGWGRILRFFMRDIPHCQLRGCDCWAEIVAVAGRDNRWCEFRTISPLPETAYASNSFDVIYLYSVFSHLSEKAHLAWVAEFRRLLRPEGLLVVTTRSANFLRLLAEKREQGKSRGLRQSMLATDAFPDADKALADYSAGRFCYAPTGGGGPLEADFYGEAVVPESWIRQNWSGFQVLEVLPPRGVVDQMVVTAKKS